jgi:hypothetical protein
VKVEHSRPDVNERIPGRHENVAGNDNVGTAELHNAVAVRDRFRFVKNLNRFVVVVEPSPTLQKSIAGPPFGWCRSGLAGGRAHAVLNILVRNNGRPLPRIGELS